MSEKNALRRTQQERKSDHEWPSWDSLRAAMEGSSFYTLPAVLRWLTASIGYHHVHHLSPRIPNYRLKQCCDSVPERKDKPPLTIRKSLSGIHLKLWDEERKQLIGFP
ncbi:MAG: fatty acid desaturase [Lentisphaeria bacterium]